MEMKRKKFPLRKKPKRSDFRDQRKEVEIMTTYDNMSIADLVSQLQQYSKKYPEGVLEVDLDYGACYYESDTPSARFILVYMVPADDQYKEAMKKYNAWYTKNREKIETELVLRKKHELSN